MQIGQAHKVAIGRDNCESVLRDEIKDEVIGCLAPGPMWVTWAEPGKRSARRCTILRERFASKGSFTGRLCL